MREKTHPVWNGSKIHKKQTLIPNFPLPPLSSRHTDTTAPYFYGGFPAASTIQGTTFTLDLKVSKANRPRIHGTCGQKG